MRINHPHFEESPHADVPNLYRSKATGQYVLVEFRASEWVALPAMPDGSRLPVHAEPLAWADDEWSLLDAVHAQR